MLALMGQVDSRFGCIELYVIEFTPLYGFTLGQTYSLSLSTLTRVPIVPTKQGSTFEYCNHAILMVALLAWQSHNLTDLFV